MCPETAAMNNGEEGVPVTDGILDYPTTSAVTGLARIILFGGDVTCM